MFEETFGLWLFDASGKVSERAVVKKGKYEYCYLFSSSDFDHFRNYSTFHSSADDVISPYMFNKSSS